jgi:hypothetical protein
MRLGASGGNDADDFFVVFLIPGMDHQQNRARSYRSNGDPAFLLGFPLALGEGIGIVENQDCSLKANIVLEQVAAVLLLVPCKFHGGPLLGHHTIFCEECQYICTYIRGRFQGFATRPPAQSG